MIINPGDDQSAAIARSTFRGQNPLFPAINADLYRRLRSFLVCAGYLYEQLQVQHGSSCSVIRMDL